MKRLVLIVGLLMFPSSALAQTSRLSVARARSVISDYGQRDVHQRWATTSNVRSCWRIWRTVVQCELDQSNVPDRVYGDLYYARWTVQARLVHGRIYVTTPGFRVAPFSESLMFGAIMLPGQSHSVGREVSIRTLSGHQLWKMDDSPPDSCGPVWAFLRGSRTVAEWDTCLHTVTVWARSLGGQKVKVSWLPNP